MGKRKTPEDYRKLAESRGFEWVGEYLGDVRAKTEWRCSRGHTWLSRYDAIRRHKGCPHCAGNARKVPSDYLKLGGISGFKWLGPTVTNARTKTKWECPKGHIFESTHDQIKGKSGCPFCSGLIPKTEEDYHLLAKSRNMKWVDDLPPNVASKSKWECSKGHIWLGIYGRILQGIGCPHCSGLVPKTADDYHALAQARDHKWIADKIPRDIHTVTKWECLKKGHIRETCYNNVKKFGCPQCFDMVNGALVSKPQRELCKMVSGELNYVCGRYRIDVALPDKMIAIEYDSWFWHGDKQGHNKRDEYVLARGWKLLRIKSDSQLPSWQQIENAFAELQTDKKKTEIILNDWGHGQTFADIKKGPSSKPLHPQLELF